MIPLNIKINDEVYDKDGNKMIIKDIWVSNFYLAHPITYIKYDYFLTNGESGTEIMPLPSFIQHFKQTKF